MSAPVALVSVQLGAGVYLPPGHAPHPEGTVVALEATHAAELVAQGHATPWPLVSPAPAVSHVDHAEPVHATAGAVFVDQAQRQPARP